jgi:hypothetical protein
MTVLRGFDPNEPYTRTSTAPVASGVTIYSGQVIYLLWSSGDSQYEWNLGCVAGSTPHLALQSSADEDVIEAGNLVGLDCSGQFEVQMAFFDTGGGQTYNVDVLLTYDGTTGNVKPTTIGSGLPIMGVVSRIRGPKDLAGVLSGDDTYLIGAVDSSALAANENVIIFKTRYQDNRQPGS